MEMENRKSFCPVIDVDGVIAGGKQFDLDITLPEDNRDVLYGVIKDCFKEPVRDAVVKLTEIVYDCGKEERRPIGHTFTDKEGEFVFGPLCPDRRYALQIWANTTKKIKVCAKCHHEGKCLKGEKCDKCDCYKDDKKHECKEDKCDCYKDDKKHECKEDKCDCYKDDKKHECKEDKKPCHKEEKCDCYKEEQRPGYQEEKYEDYKNKCCKR